VICAAHDPAPQHSEIASRLNSHREAVTRGSIASLELQPADDPRLPSSVFIIAAGQVRVSIYSASGIAVAFSDLGPGDIFGEFAAIDGAPRSAGIEAQSRCLVASISSGVFREMLESEPAAMLALLRKVIMTARQMTARVYEFSVLPVSDRVHAELLRMAKTTPTQGKSIAISPAPTNAEIASRISTHREAVSREIKNLSRIGIVERRDGILWIKDVEWLASKVHEETGE
jgi:CRP/FNR family cyclic AMP-dependent transcriptional regulator